MIILSVGMPRAGSGWYYNLTQALALAAGAQDARAIRKRYHLGSILTEVNCNIGALTPRRLLMVLVPSLLGNTFVIKAHAYPTPFAQFLIRSKHLTAAYIYRDPRDAMLSAAENGQHALEKGHPNAFSPLVDFNANLRFMQEYVRISEAWLACPPVHHTRYEDLVGDYFVEADRLVAFLGYDAQDARFQQVIDRYQPAGASRTQQGSHFRTGRQGRFRQKFAPEQQALANQAFKSYLEKMNYPLE